MNEFIQTAMTMLVGIFIYEAISCVRRYHRSPASGMSLRQYFAARALQGICANPDCEPEDVKHNAIVAIRNADALLAQFDATGKATP